MVLLSRRRRDSLVGPFLTRGAPQRACRRAASVILPTARASHFDRGRRTLHFSQYKSGARFALYQRELKVQTQPRKLRLLLVDDHAVVREGLRSLLGTDNRFDIVGEAADGLTAVSAAEHLNPDVVVMDVSLPGLNGAQLARRLKEQLPHVKTLALTVHEEGGYLRSLMDAGASGYVLKRSAASELLRAIEVVGEGGTYLDSAIAGQLVSKLGQRRPSVAPSSALSEREREVVRFVAHGYSNKEIATKLDVSVKTVETYRYRATEKLGLHSRADLVRYAIDQGWLADA
jgi:DNA-binding NarL/FixJ family response regulator